MDFLERFKSTKQKAFEHHRPCYPVPQYMSERDSQRLSNARDDLQRAYNKEMAKPASQRNSDLAYKMDLQLNPRMCGW